MGSSGENEAVSCNTDLSEKRPNSWIRTSKAVNGWRWCTCASLARRDSARLQLVPVMGTQRSAAEWQRTSAHPACKVSGGNLGSAEEKWILSRGVSAWRQIVRYWFCLNYFMVSKINLANIETHLCRVPLWSVESPGLVKAMVHQCNLWWGWFTQ